MPNSNMPNSKMATTAIPPDRDLIQYLKEHDSITSSKSEIYWTSHHNRRRNSSYTGLPPVQEDGPLHLNTERRRSADWLDEIDGHIILLGQTLRHRPQTLPDKYISSRRGSAPHIAGAAELDRYKSYGRRNRRASLQSDLSCGDSSAGYTASSIPRTVSTIHLPKVKIILLGDAGVGKSTFLYTFYQGRFLGLPSNANVFLARVNKTINFNGQEVELDIQDTAGQERYRTLTSSYYRHSHGAFLFFNVYNQRSFDNIRLWLDEMEHNGTRDIPVVVVGLKYRSAPRNHRRGSRCSNDNEDDNNNNSISTVISESGSSKSSQDMRVVPLVKAEHFAERDWNIPYTEVDPKNNHASITVAFYKLLNLIMTVHPLAPPDPEPIDTIKIKSCCHC